MYTTDDQDVMRFINKLESLGAIIDNVAYLVVVNYEQPSKSYILRERVE